MKISRLSFFLGAVLAVLFLVTMSFLVVVQTDRVPDHVRKERNTVLLIMRLDELLDAYHEATGRYPCEAEALNQKGNCFPCMVDVVSKWDVENLLWAVSLPGRLVTRGGPSTVLLDKNACSFQKLQFYVLDSWGRPVVYRVVSTDKALDGVGSMRALVYSLGPDGVDDWERTTNADDIGNW